MDRFALLVVLAMLPGLLACGSGSGGGEAEAAAMPTDVLLAVDLSSVGEDVDSQWSPTTYFRGATEVGRSDTGNLDQGQTLPQLQPGPAFQLTAESLVSPSPFFPDAWSDVAALPTDVDRADYGVFIFDQARGFQQEGNLCSVRGLSGQREQCPVPFVSRTAGPATLRVIFDSDGTCGENSQVTIEEDQGSGFVVVFQGTLAQLRQNAGFVVHQNTSRKFSFRQIRVE